MEVCVNIDDILDLYFDAGTQERGHSYFRQGRVGMLKKETLPRKDNGTLDFISAWVQGSRGQRYETQVAVYQDQQRWSLDTFCSCPMRTTCKHAVAVILAYEESLAQSGSTASSSRQQRQALQWLKELQTLAVSASANTNNSQSAGETLCYEIYPTKGQGLELHLKVKRYLKDGSLSKAKGRSISPDFLVHNINSGFAFSYLLPQDQEILQQLPAHNIYGAVPLQGKLGSQLLAQMLATGRLLWQINPQPLVELTGEHSLELKWQHKAELQQLVFNLNADQHLLNTEPAWMYDAQAHGLQAVASEFSSRERQMLLQAPAMTPEQSQSLFVDTALPLVHKLPLPQTLRFQTQTDPLVPTLFIDQWALGAQQWPVVGLLAGYGSQVLTLDAQHWPAVTRMQKGSSLLDLHRQPEAEQQALAQLQAAGMVIIESDPAVGVILAPLDLFGSPPSLGQYYQNWQDFIEHHLPELQAQGWVVMYSSEYQLSIETVTELPPLQVQASEEGGWFELGFDLQLPSGEHLPLLPLLVQTLEQYPRGELPDPLLLEHQPGQFIQLARSLIEPLLHSLYELYERPLTQGRLRLENHQAGRLQSMEIDWQQQPQLQQLSQALSQGLASEQADINPEGLQASLRPYQQQGLNWLQNLARLGFGALLADDMGLGKTLQTLSHLLYEKQQGRLQQPALLVSPTSLVGNWRTECQRFTPSLRVLVLQGPERQQQFAHLDQFDLIISTYPLLSRDLTVLAAHRFSWLILDEAQNIKNSKSQARQCLQELQSQQRLCLTGTPMENHLGELWSIFDFLVPGLLGSERQFNQLYRKTIEKQGDSERAQRLQRRIAPFMLRRTKQQVMAELPEKTEIICSIELGAEQAALYESIRLTLSAQVRELLAQKGLARSSIEVLDALLKLRQVCCHPQLLKLPSAAKVTESAKMDWLNENLPEMLAEGRRVLIFSQFTQMLALIEQQLQQANIGYSKLTGQTRKRPEAIDVFTSGQVPVFLISLKAGGVGLNLTQADTVIHFDPWWNPAAENQASDRAHRIGQTRNVFVYKLVVANSLEERILALQASKQALADQLYGQGEAGVSAWLSDEVLAELLQPL